MQRNREKQQNGKGQRSLQEIWRYQGNISCKDGHNKGQNSKDLTQAEEINTWQEHTKELHVKSLNDLDNHDYVVTNLEPNILECEVKRALGSVTMNKAGGGFGISAQLFQILKDDAVKGLHLIYQQIWKTEQWPQDWKRSVFIPIPKKAYAKECPNYCTIAPILHASKIMLKTLQARLQHELRTENFQIFKLDLEKAEEPEIKLPISAGLQKKQWNSKKTKTNKQKNYCFIDYTKGFDCVDHNKLWKILRDGNSRST